MDQTVFWNLELQIKPGKQEVLKSLAAEMSEATKANEPGAFNYEWNVSEDGTECHIFERYANSDALMIHLGNFQENFAGRFFEVLDIKKWVVYGHANDQ
ncbi:MAG: antibiotic biosynthesis monooxygenase, partial [Saprospiraceae bacterium]|nr:antibiotic biosynthesis monooxygenase [Saprospiraceae bacterium]